MFTAIWACNEDNVIGDGEKLLWDIPEDLKWFKEKTLNQTVIMGRKTWDSLPFKPLPNRTNIVLSRQSLQLPDKVQLISSLEEIENIGTPVIMGGSTLYREALPYTTIIFRTLVRKPIKKSDNLVYAPEVPTEFKLLTETSWIVSAKENIEYKHQTFSRN